LLKNKRREFLYAMSIFGPNLIMAMLLAYFTSAIDPRNLGEDIELWAWVPNTEYWIVIVSIFGTLFTVSRIFDALIDVPLASLIDRTKNKYKRIRMPILIGIVPMIAAAVALCFPLNLDFDSVPNTWWFFGMLIVFFAFYTLTTLAFFSSLPSVCKDRKQRTRIAYFKAFIDTVQYALAYALAPLILNVLRNIRINGTPINIMHVILMMTPLMLTILIPVFMSIGREKKDLLEANALNNAEKAENLKPAIADTESDAENGEKEQKAGIFNRIAFAFKSIFKSLAFVFKSRAYWPWLIVACLYFMGLQLFLSAQNDLISGVLQLGVIWSAVLNAAAFGPVPIMLYFFNKILKKKGVRFAFQLSLLFFASGIMCFSIGSAVLFPNSIIPRIIINAIGGTISSFAIGSFFMMPTMITSQVAAVDRKVTKRNNNAMYFAGQGIVLGIAVAITTGVIWNNGLKGIGVLEVASTLPESGGIYSIPLGGFISPFIVAGLSLLAFGVSFLMPKRYDVQTIGKYFDKNYVPDAADLSDNEVVQKTESE